MKRLLSTTLLVASVLLATTHLAAFTGGYSIGINFGSAEPDGANQGGLAATDAAGIDTAVQANWNNFPDGTQAAAQSLLADDEGAPLTTSATVTWVSTLTWSSTGRGEENNQFPDGPDRTLMLGYLDTANSSTTAVTIQNIPTELTSSGYNVIVYALGGVVNRGGSYRVLSAPGTPLSDYKLVSSPGNPTGYTEDTGESHDASGTYVVFNGLSASTLIIEATTAVNPLSGTPRAPINAVQLVQLGGEVRPVIRPATANAAGFTVFVDDIGAAVVDPATVTTVLDGAGVTPSVSKVGSRTTIRYSILADQNTFFASGSQHSLVITLRDAQGAETVANQNFTVAPYNTVPSSYALAAPATTPGFVVTKVFQTTAARSPGASANNTPSAEMQLVGGMVDANSGAPLPNIAENAGPINIGGDSDGSLWWTANVNWEQGGAAGPGDINPNPPQPDNFNSIEPAGSGGLYANEALPGPLLSDDPNNCVIETVTYVDLKRGLHRWGVNSDEGFKVTVAPGQPSALGVVLGQFSGTRTAADTLFDFVVETDGHYPIRLLWWEGSGEASCEWFSVNIDTGEKILIGDVANEPAGAYAVFRTGQGRARVQSLVPADGYQGAAPSQTIKATLQDGTTTVVDGATKLWLDGIQVTAQIQNGATTTVTYTPASPFQFGSAHNGALVWDESTTPVTTHSNYFTFTVESLTPADLPANSFWIEAEDYDHSRGQTVAAASTMPYGGGAYANLVGIVDVDYYDNETGQYNAETSLFTDGVVGYRGSSRTGPNAMFCNPSTVQGTEAFAMDRPNNFRMTTNLKIGWVGGDNWWNYTRTIPAGVYRAYAAMSLGDTGNMNAQLWHVTAGAGQSNSLQVLKNLGTFRGSGSTGWSQNVLCQLKDSLGNNTAVKLPGGAVTLRWQGGNGDIDWMVLAPDPAFPASVASLSPANNSTNNAPDVQVVVELEDFGSAVDPESIELSFDAADVTPQAVISKAGDITTISYDPGTLAGGSTHTYTIAFSDDATPPKANSTTVTFSVVASEQPEIDSIVINTDGSITVTWTGSAVLESAPSVTGPWTVVEGATSPATFQPTESMLFGRLRQP